MYRENGSYDKLISNGRLNSIIMIVNYWTLHLSDRSNTYKQTSNHKIGQFIFSNTKTRFNYTECQVFCFVRISESKWYVEYLHRIVHCVTQFSKLTKIKNNTICFTFTMHEKKRTKNCWILCKMNHVYDTDRE